MSSATGFSALLAFVALFGAAAASAGSFDRSVEVSGSEPSLVVRLERGTISVDVHSGSTIRIEARARGLGAENVHFQLRQQAGQWVLGAQSAEWLTHLAAPPRVAVRAWVPAGTAVELETLDGAVMARRVKSGLRARTTGDAIRLEAAGGPLDLASSGGAVVANFASAPSGRVVTEGGPMDLRLPVDARLDLDASSAGGRVVVDGANAIVHPAPRTKRLPLRTDRARGRVNGGGDVLQLRGAGGNIHVHWN